MRSDASQHWDGSNDREDLRSRSRRLGLMSRSRGTQSGLAAWDDGMMAGRCESQMDSSCIVLAVDLQRAVQSAGRVCRWKELHLPG